PTNDSGDPVFGSVTVSQAPVITWSNPADITYGDALGSTQLDATANVPGTFSYTLADGTSAAAGAVLNAGQGQPLNVTFTPDDTADYTTATWQVAINVDPAALTVTGSGTRVYGGSPSFAVDYSGFVLSQNSSVLGGTLAFAIATSSSSDVGTYPNAVTPSGLTSTNYAISFVAGSMIVTPAPLTVTGSGAQVYGGSPSFAAAYSGFVLGQNSSALGGTLAFATTTSTSSNVGTYQNAVTASGLVSTNYAISFATGNMVVTAAPLTITGSGTQVYGGSPSFAAAYSGFVLGQNSGALGGTLAFATTTSSASHAGTYHNAVTPSGLTSTNYAISFATGDIVVTPVALTITADDTSKVYGAALPTLTASYSGFVNGDTAASLTTSPTLTTTATASSHVSGNPYSITASGALDADYTISYVPGALTVTPAALTITADDKSKVYGAALPTLTASYAGFVNVSRLHHQLCGRRPYGHARRADDYRRRQEQGLRSHLADALGQLRRFRQRQYRRKPDDATGTRDRRHCRQPRVGQPLRHHSERRG
ncbi:MAG: hypothetical protein B7Z74_05865, partial [Deltaproteobacteria bacterium 21-66-5]